jgi:hypothetical protein
VLVSSRFTGTGAPCHLFRLASWELDGMCELASVAQRRHVGDLPAFGLFLLPRGVPGCLSEASFVMDEKKLIILVQGHECLYNLQHKDYDNNLVKDNSWKEIAGELHAQDKELSRRAQHCRRMTGERHAMCESAFNTAGELHGMCESAFTASQIVRCYP